MTTEAGRSKPHPNCPAKHTAFQPSDSEWRCPKCGADAEQFYIEESDEHEDPNCPALHDGDEVVCRSCDNSWSGAQVAKLIEAKSDVKTCPCCKGSGIVPRSEKPRRDRTANLIKLIRDFVEQHYRAGNMGSLSGDEWKVMEGSPVMRRARALLKRESKRGRS